MQPAELRNFQEASMPEAQIPGTGALGSSVDRGDDSLLP
jgi:hypothetical protein